jgi:hypothetical protein
MAAVLCNADPLIALGRLNRLDLLASLFDQVRTLAGCTIVTSRWFFYESAGQ